MKNMMKMMVLTAAVIAGMAVSSQAVQINGDIAFSGGYTIDNPNLAAATKFLTFFSVEVEDGSGDYAGTAGEPVTFSPFAFNGTETLPFTLWTFTVGPTTYLFSASDLTVSFANANNLVVEGSGFANITGFDQTAGYWNVTANKAGTSFSFSSSAVVAGVPDGGMTLSLLGFGLAGLAFVRRAIRA